MTAPKEDPANRRRHTRVPLCILVQHRFGSFEEFAQDQTLNLSEGGMFLRTTNFRPEGAVVFFQLMLNSGARLVEGMGKVVRCISDEDAKPNQGMAIEFVHLDEYGLNVIREALAQANPPEDATP